MSNVMISANYLRALCKWFKRKWIDYGSLSESFSGDYNMNYTSTNHVVSVGELLAFLYYISKKVCKNGAYDATTKDNLITQHQELLIDQDVIQNKVKQVLNNCFTTVTTQVSPKGAGMIFVDLNQCWPEDLIYIHDNTNIVIKAVKGINYQAYQVPTPGYQLNTSIPNITGTSSSNATTFNTSADTLLIANYTANYLATNGNYFYYVSTISDTEQIRLFGNVLTMRGGNTSDNSTITIVNYTNTQNTTQGGNTTMNSIIDDYHSFIISAYPCVKSDDPKGHTYILKENSRYTNKVLPGYQYLQKVVINTSNGLEAGNYVNMPELTDVYINSGTQPCTLGQDQYFPVSAFHNNPKLDNMYINLDHPLCLRAETFDAQYVPFCNNASNFTIWVRARTIPFYLNDTLMTSWTNGYSDAWTGWVSSGASTYISSAYKYRVTQSTSSSGGYDQVTTLQVSQLRSNTAHKICIQNPQTNSFWLADITSSSCSSGTKVGSSGTITSLNNFHIIYSDYPLTNSTLTSVNTRYGITVDSGSASYKPYVFINDIAYTDGILIYENTPVEIAVTRPGYSSSFKIYKADGSLQENAVEMASFILTGNIQIRSIVLTPINYTVSVTSANGSVEFKVNNASKTATQNGNIYTINNVHIGDSVQMTIYPNTNYEFSRWNDGPNTATRTITIGTSDESFTATCTSTVVNTYTVVVNNNGNGTAVITKVNGEAITETTTTQVSAGNTVTIKSKNPTSGYSFDKWSDGVYIDERTITINQNTTITAMFDVGTSPSPSYFTRADFLQSLAPSSDNGGFIDTGLPMSNSNVYNSYRHEFKLRFDDTNYAAQGAIWNSNGGTFGVINRTNDNNIALKRSKDGPNGNNTLTKTISKDNQWHIYDLNSPTAIKIDGNAVTSTSQVQISTSSSSVPQGNIILFGRVCYPWNGTSFIQKQYQNYTGYYNTYKMSIAYYKIYNSSGTLLHYFIPARFMAQGGVYGMWDRISGNFIAVTNNYTDWQLGTF